MTSFSPKERAADIRSWSWKRHHSLVLVKLLIAAALIWGLFRYGAISLADMGIVLERPQVALVAASLVFLALIVGVFRWQLLLRGAGIAIGYFRLLQFYCIGAFASTFLPGGAGGDAVRAIYIFRAATGRRTAAVLSVMADRAIGLFGFLSIGLALVIIERDVIFANRASSLFGLVVAALFLAAILSAIGIAAFVGPLGRISFLQHTKTRWKFRQRLLQVIEVILIYRGKLRLLLAAWAISLVIPGLLAAIALVFARAFHFEQLGDVDYLIAALLANIANAIPLSPGGIGIGEGAFHHICRLLEPVPSDTPYGTIFFAFRIIVLLVNLASMTILIVSWRGPIFPSRVTKDR